MSAGDFQGTYSAEQVIVTVGGLIISGMTDGDFVTAKYEEDRYMPYVGADGEVGRSKNASRLGTIEIVLAHTSLANTELSSLFNLSLIGGIDNPIPFGVADLSGRGLVTASKCWLKMPPDWVRGKEIGECTWTLQAADLSMKY